MNSFLSRIFFKESKIVQSDMKWPGLLLFAFVLLLLGLWSGAAEGKLPHKVSLDNGAASGSAALIEAFRQERSKLGGPRERIFAIEYPSAEEKE